jgi:hypothetical protein
VFAEVSTTSVVSIQSELISGSTLKNYVWLVENKEKIENATHLFRPNLDRTNFATDRSRHA